MMSYNVEEGAEVRRRDAATPKTRQGKAGKKYYTIFRGG
jgi:hypothetical protein